MNWTHSSTSSIQKQLMSPPLLAHKKQTSHPPLTHSFPVTWQLSHLPISDGSCCCSIVVSYHYRECWDWMVVCQTRWSAAQGHHRGLYSHHPASLWTPQFCHMQKYSDDSAVVGCPEHWWTVLWHSVGNNHFILNVNKTMENIVGFRMARNTSNSISIMGEEVKVVEGNNYLSIHLDKRLNWRYKTDAVYKKGWSRLNFFRRLRSLSVCIYKCVYVCVCVCPILLIRNQTAHSSVF